ncbi:MAG: outer rane autotransporter barrel domain protein [Pedosphaera sp.]|nr:outer rane autotransporter barrel domain protein [Pedosphaera sp.]
MKTKRLLPQHLSVLLLAAALTANSVWATNVIKQDTTTMQPTLTDWSAAPGTGDIGEFDATISSGNAANLTLGGNLSIGALQFDGTLNGPVTIGADGNTLTLNNAGTDLDASAANQNIKINCAVSLGANQTWNVASGRTLTVGGVISGVGTLTKSGAGALTLTNNNTFAGTTTVSGGTLQLSPLASFGTVINSTTNIVVQNGGNLSVTNRTAIFRTSQLWVQNGGTYTIQGGAPDVGYLQFDTGATLNFTGPSAGGINVDSQDGAFGTYKTVVMGSVTVPASSVNGLVLRPLLGGAVTTQTVQFDGTGTGATVSQFILQNGNTGVGGTNTVIFDIADSPSAAVDMNVAALNTQADGTRIRPIIKQGTGVMQVSGAIPVNGVNYDMIVNGGTMIFANKASFKSLTVNSGNAQVPVGFGSSTPVSVTATAGNTATFIVAVLNIKTNLSCPSLTVDNTVGTSSGLQFNFGVLTPSTTAAPLAVPSGVNFITPPTITITGTSLPTTTGDGYPLITWGSGPSTTNGMNLVLPSYFSGSLSIVGNTLYLQINASAAPIYSWGGGSGTWDVNNSGNTIWKDTNSVSTYYVDTNVVVFDNTVGSGGTVTLNTIVNPFSVTVTNPTADYTISGSGAIAGFTGLTKSGAGKLTLATTNSYAGLTTISGGTLQIGNGTVDGSIASSYTIVDEGTLAFNLAGNQTIPSSQVISGSGNLTKSGAGTLTLPNGSSYTGTTTISGGTLQLSQSTASQTNPTNLSANIIVQNGGTLLITNRASFSRTSLLRVQAGGTLAINGSAPSFGYLQFDTGATLNFPLPGGVPGYYLFASDGAYNVVVLGSVTVPTAAAFGFILDPLTIGVANTQTVQFDGTGTGAMISQFTFQNGNTIFGGNNDTIFNIAHSPSATVDMNVYQWDTQGDSTRIRTITKQGAGILQVSTNTPNSANYALIVNGGSMVFSNSANFQSVSVNSSGTLGGIGPVGNTTTVESGGTVSPGTPASRIGTLTIANLTMNSGATALFELNKASSPATNDYLVVSGGQSITGSTLTVSNLGPALVVGDRFILLSQPTSGFTTVNLPAGYTWANNLDVDGSIQVLSVTSVAPSPTNITYTVGNNQMVLNWPAGQGWVLQAQTNSLSVGLTTNWFDVAGATPPFTININPANPTVFYRLKY